MKSYLPVILVAAGGMLGALARYGLAGLVQGNRLGFPVGTLTANLIGCLMMGFFARWLEVGIANAELRFLVGIGFLGALTTFSTFSFESLRLFLDQNPISAMLYILYTAGGCLLLTAVGYLLARAIWT